MELMESVKVGVRVRPFVDGDARSNDCVVVKDQEVVLFSHVPKTFRFDHCFTPADGQTDIYQEFGNHMVSDALNGYSGCFLTYGQTGSGKSYTIMGTEEHPGLIPRSLVSVFSQKLQLPPTSTLRIWVSYMEIYNEQIRDLLWPGDDTCLELKVLDHPRLGVCIPQLTEAVCDTTDDVKHLLDFGTKRRALAATHVSGRSSRSHAIFGLRLEFMSSPCNSSNNSQRNQLCSKLLFVDLAGSERQALSSSDGLLLKEGCAINHGLSALVLVAKELGEHQAQQSTFHLSKSCLRHQVGFRTSKLTQLLKDALSGNSKTSLIAAVVPNVECLDETTSTLTFASSMARIKTAPVQNKGRREEFVELLQEEVRKLREYVDQLPCAAPNLHALSAQAMDLESLVDFTSREYEVQVKLSSEMCQARRDCLRSYGLPGSFEDELSPSEKSLPYLLNMSDDPMVSGCLCYYLQESQHTLVGCGDGADIRLHGIGVNEHICTILNVMNLEISVTKVYVMGRLCVNGRLVQEGVSKRLQHGDRIYFGRAHAFRLSVPIRIQENDQVHCGLSLAGLEDEWTALEDSPSWLGLQDYLKQVLIQMPTDQSQRLFADMKRACKLCDEANEITSECRAEEGFHFEVDLTSTVPSSIVVRVLQAELAVGTEGVENELWTYVTLYLWSVPQMAERLERMRDYHEAKMRTGVAEVDPLLDPWYEAHPGAISRRLIELEMFMHAERDQAEQMRMNRYTSVSRSLTQRSRNDIITRDVFGAWASAVSSARKVREKPARVSTSSASRSTPSGQRGSFKTGLAPPRPRRLGALPTQTAGTETPTENGSRRVRDQALTSSGSRRSGIGAGSLKARIGSPRGRNSSFAIAMADLVSDAPATSSTNNGVIGTQTEDTGALDSGNAKVSDSVSGASEKIPAVRLPSRSGSVAGSSQCGTENLTDCHSSQRAHGQANSLDLSAKNSQSQTPNGWRGGTGADEAVASENEMLKKQLEAAWHLCHMLRSKMNEAETSETKRVSPTRNGAVSGYMSPRPGVQVDSKATPNMWSRPSSPSVVRRMASDSHGQHATNLHTPIPSMSSTNSLSTDVLRTRSHSPPSRHQVTRACGTAAFAVQTPIAQVQTVYPSHVPFVPHQQQAHSAQVMSCGTLASSTSPSVISATPSIVQPAKRVERLVSSPLPAATVARNWSMSG